MSDNNGGGRMIYFGPTNRVVAYFTQPLLGYRFTHHHNSCSSCDDGSITGDQYNDTEQLDVSSSSNSASHNNNKANTITNTTTAMNIAEFIMQIATQNTTTLARVIEEDSDNVDVLKPSAYEDIATTTTTVGIKKRSAMELSQFYRRSEYYSLYATSQILSSTITVPTSPSQTPLTAIATISTSILHQNHSHK